MSVLSDHDYTTNLVAFRSQAAAASAAALMQAQTDVALPAGAHIQ